MRVAVTGTPGTGKTSATEFLERTDGDEGETNDIEVIHLNEHVETERLYTGVDEARSSLVADLDGLADWLDDRENTRGPETGDGGGDDPDHDDGDGDGDDAETVVVESHLAHLLPADRVVVLRCHPEELKRRLRERGVDERKREENAESEALDVILAEAVKRHGIENVYEIDTTDRTPAKVGARVASVVAGERAPSAGTVSFLDYFE